MENLLAGRIGTKDGHGGKADEHYDEMEEIARKVVQNELDEKKDEFYQLMCRAYEQALRDVLGVLEYDVHSVTKIGIDGCKELFESEKAQKFISDQIMRHITKELNSKHFKM